MAVFNYSGWICVEKKSGNPIAIDPNSGGYWYVFDEDHFPFKPEWFKDANAAREYASHWHGEIEPRIASMKLTVADCE